MGQVIIAMLLIVFVLSLIETCITFNYKNEDMDLVEYVRHARRAHRKVQQWDEIQAWVDEQWREEFGDPWTED